MGSAIPINIARFIADQIMERQAGGARARGRSRRTCTGAYTSRFCRDRAEEVRPVHDLRLRKAGSGEQLRDGLPSLTGVYSEAERDDATTLENALYLPQSGGASGHACIELIASALSKASSANGSLSTEP
jgi:hypothetical protein